MEKALHHLAYTYYEEGKFTEAIALYRFLVMQDMANFSYWLGLGAALFAQDALEEAEKAFTHAASLNYADTRPQEFLSLIKNKAYA